MLADVDTTNEAGVKDRNFAGRPEVAGGDAATEVGANDGLGCVADDQVAEVVTVEVLCGEADAAAGWRFSVVRAGNRLKALLFGHWHQGFRFRTADEWRDCFTAAGFDVEARAAGEGTPFGNVLFILTRSLRASA